MSENSPNSSIGRFYKTFFVLTIVMIMTIFFLIEAIDPYGIYNNNFFHLKYTYANGVLRTGRLIEILKRERNILVFGDSKSARITREILHENVINLFSIYGNPLAVIDFLNRLDETSIKNISKIYYCIDWSCFVDEGTYDKVDYQDWLQVLIYKIRHFNLRIINFAQQKVYRNLTGVSDDYYDPKGYVIRTKIHRADFPKIPYNDVKETSKDIVSVLSKIDRFAKDHHIEIVYFMPTYPAQFVKLWDFKMFSRQIRLYLNYIDGLYDLTYVEGISNNRELFSDFNHLSTIGVKRLFETGFNSKSHITLSNVDTHLEEYKKYFKGSKTL